MKNLLVFVASCGHIEFREITDEEWEQWTAPKTVHPPVGKPVENYKNPTRIGRKTRAVYIYPLRFMICGDCANTVLLEE